MGDTWKLESNTRPHTCCALDQLNKPNMRCFHMSKPMVPNMGEQDEETQGTEMNAPKMAVWFIFENDNYQESSTQPW